MKTSESGFHGVKKFQTKPHKTSPWRFYEVNSFSKTTIKQRLFFSFINFLANIYTTIRSKRNIA